MNDKLKPSKRVIIYEECVDDSSDVSENDIIEYGQRLGIDITANPTLATLVRDWILQPLPRYWFPCLDTRTGQWFYSNALNGQSVWQHPLEEIHRNLATEYLFCQTIRERENPEGESSEQSMESGFSTKGLGGLSSSTMGGLSPVRTPLPRTLAPLKRIPKLESTTNVLTTSPNPLPPFCVASTSDSHNEQVRQVSFSTFKSSDTISSLLPGDLLFENRDRPTTIVAPFNHSVLPVSTARSLRNKPVDSKDDDPPQQMKQAPTYPSSAIRNLSALTTDKAIVKELSSSASNCQQEPVIQLSKPRISFTERLAAKKASQRMKSNESSESCLSNANELDLTSVINSEKKHVHFDLEPNHYRQYTPECSEENKATERSESSSSEDILELVGDPEYLKPLTDVKCYPVAYEEKRWEVSFTSFGLTSPNVSPVKISTAFIDNEDSSEMVTRFNSEFCPSPLSVSDKSDPADMAKVISTISPDNLQNQTNEEAEKQVPSLEMNFESRTMIDVLPEIEIHVPTLYENSPVPLSDPLPLPAHKEDDEQKLNVDFVFAEADKPSLSIADNNGKAAEDTEITSHIISKKPELQAAEDVPPMKFSLKNSTPKLLRSVTRSESLEESVLASKVSPVIIQDIPTCPVEFVTCDTKLIKPQNHVVQMDDALNLNTMQEASQLNLLLPPASFIEISPTAIQAENLIANSSINCDTSDALVPHEKTIQPIEDWQTIKKEMESKLENEKKRLESWFTSEIAQIKEQFENQLASERERTENLSKLIENAKSEKEELAKREIVRLEETSAHLVEEKTHQVQTQLNSDILQSNNSVLHRTVAHQDANVQTEEPPIPVSSLPMEQMTPPLKVEEIETTESSPPKNETSSRWENRDSRIHCQCDSLQKQVARVEREMQLLKQRNLAFQKNPPTRKKNTPVKAQREPWWLDTDESTTSNTSSVSDWRHSRVRSQSMTNLHASRSDGRKSTPIQRARELLSKSQTPRRAWMEELSTDHSLGDMHTSGISSAIPTGEWDSVLSSIQKISGDLQEVWSHIGPRPRPLSYLSYQSPLWMPSSQSFMTNDRVPLHWSFNGSTAERTQALRLWLQQNKTQHSKPFL